MTRTTAITAISLLTLLAATGCGHGNSRVGFELGRPDRLDEWTKTHDAKVSLAGRTQSGGPVSQAPPQGAPQQMDPLQQAGIVYRDASLAASAAADMVQYAAEPMAWACAADSKADLSFFGNVADELGDALESIEKSMQEDEPWDQLGKLNDGMANLRAVANRLDREFSRRPEFEPIRSRIPDQFRIVDEMMAEWGMHVSYVYSEVKQFDNSPSAWSVVASVATGHDFSDIGGAVRRFRAPTMIRPVPAQCYQRFAGMGGCYRGFDSRSIFQRFTGVSVAVAHGDGGTAVGVGVGVQR